MSKPKKNHQSRWNKKNQPYNCAVTNDYLKAFDAMQDALLRTADMLDESHQYDRDSNHAGDGPEGCTYCEALAQARAALTSAAQATR